ncbi:MAG: hypothetical protein OCD02_10200 [Spirochaetaceae bacterium]
MATHRNKTVERASKLSTVLVIQDTSYLIYTSNTKTIGLGTISLKKGENIDKIYSQGLVMHTCLALTTSGTPLRLIDQNIFARQLRPENQRRSMGGKYIQDVLPVERKESFRWIKALQKTMKTSIGEKTVTVCDRECDFYDFLKQQKTIDTSVLVRAFQNRTINRSSRYAQ